MTIIALTNGSFKVAYVAEYYPLLYTKITGEMAGYAVETFRIVASLFNRTLDFVHVEEYGDDDFYDREVNWTGATKEIILGNVVTLLDSNVATPSRIQSFNEVGPILIDSIDLYERARNKASVESKTLLSFTVFTPLVFAMFVIVFKIIDVLKYSHEAQHRTRTSRTETSSWPHFIIYATFILFEAFFFFFYGSAYAGNEIVEAAAKTTEFKVIRQKLQTGEWTLMASLPLQDDAAKMLLGTQPPLLIEDTQELLEAFCNASLTSKNRYIAHLYKSQLVFKPKQEPKCQLIRIPDADRFYRDENGTYNQILGQVNMYYLINKKVPMEIVRKLQFVQSAFFSVDKAVGFWSRREGARIPDVTPGQSKVSFSPITYHRIRPVVHAYIVLNSLAVIVFVVEKAMLVERIKNSFCRRVLRFAKILL